ncbi:Ig-like domain-containing protein [Duffyella gerundensis]|uniref:Ig-like domain-containing protein n=1 Tax=Duffyella gerundensis TaxID=1619313 RepID=UPI0016546A12|nr:Ig-like domain-containing protein [Duffyella gerundensis]
MMKSIPAAPSRHDADIARRNAQGVMSERPGAPVMPGYPPLPPELIPQPEKPPVVPETPVEPERPSLPDWPDEPPSPPVMPEIPPVPVVPETPVEPERPSLPGWPDEPPSPPVMPEIPPVPVVPETPVEPERPSLPGFPDEPPSPPVISSITPARTGPQAPSQPGLPENPHDPTIPAPPPTTPIVPIIPPTPVDPETPPGPAPRTPVIDGLYDRTSADQPIDNFGASFDNAAMLKGTGEPSSYVAIFDARQQLMGYARVNTEGNWSYTLPQGLTGEHQLSARAVDMKTLQPVGEAGNAVDFTLYQMNIHLIYANNVANSGELKDGDRTEDSTPLIGGFTTPNTTLVIRENGNLLRTIHVDESGHWAYSPREPLGNGEREITFSVLDQYGNEHLSDSTFTLIIDAPVPEIPEPPELAPGPTIEGIYDNRNGEKLIENGGVSLDASPVLRGTGEPSTFVAIFYGDHQFSGFAWVNEQGNWHHSPQIYSAGEQRFYAQSMDLNTGETLGAPGNSVEFTLYDLKINFALDNIGEDRNLLENGAHTDDTMPQLLGYVTPGTVIVVRDNGDLLHSFKVDGSGHWTFTPTSPLPGGQNDLTFNLKDSNGVEHSSDVQFTLHIDAPSTFSVNGLLEEPEALLFAAPAPEVNDGQPAAPTGFVPVAAPLLDEWNSASVDQ